VLIVVKPDERRDSASDSKQRSKFRSTEFLHADLLDQLNAIVLKVSNGSAAVLNSRIKMIKVRSRGFRNKERFANAIYFHLGGLALYPAGIVK